MIITFLINVLYFVLYFIGYVDVKIGYCICFFIGILVLFYLSYKFETLSEILCVVYISVGLIGIVVVEDYAIETQTPYMSFYAGYFFGKLFTCLHNYLIRFSDLMLLYLTFFLCRTAILGGEEIIPFIIGAICDLAAIVSRYQKEKAERRLFKTGHADKEELTKFKDLLASALPQGLLILSDPVNWVYYNKSFRRIFGTPPKDKEGYFKALKINQKIEDVRTLRRKITTMRDKDLNDIIYEFASTKKTERMTLIANTTTDKKRTFEVKLFWILWDGNDHMALLFNDITDQQRLMVLKISAANKDKIIATISHELRTPLNGMLGMIQIMEGQTNDPELKYNLSIFKKSSMLLLHLVNSILDLQQLKFNKFKLNLSMTDLLELFEEVKSLFEFQCQQKHIAIDINIAENVPKKINTDRSRLSQILINLVGNALKFTFKGGITLGARKDDEDPKKVYIWVSDTGIGIKEENKKILFSMYGKPEDPESINREGVGLGLSICKELVEQLCPGEEIKLESTYGKGSTFGFRIASLEEPEHSLNDSLSVILEEKQCWSDEKKSRTHLLSTHRSRLALEPLLSPMQTQPESTDKKNFLEVPVINFPTRLGGSMSHLDETNDQLLTISIREPSLRTPRASPKGSVASSPRGRGQAVLLVDDNPFNLIVAQTFLQKLSFTVVTAMNGQLAIDAVLKHAREGVTFSFILMDLQMPVMDGYEATKKLRELMKKGEIERIPILALSANDSEDVKEECMRIGIEEHLTKPIMEADLHKIVEKYCVNKELPQT